MRYDTVYEDAMAEYNDARDEALQKLDEAQQEIDERFADVRALAAQCRFANCMHEKEPDCAVRAAIERGELDPRRLKLYRDMTREADFARSHTAKKK